MSQWCIAYGCTNFPYMKIKKSWHCLPLENKKLLSKWLTKIWWKYRPVNEHCTQGCCDHYKADCFKKMPCSLCVNLNQGLFPQCFALCKNTEKTSSRAKISLKKAATFIRKQPLSWYGRMWTWHHGVGDGGVWRRMVEKENQRIGAIPVFCVFEWTIVTLASLITEPVSQLQINCWIFWQWPSRHSWHSSFKCPWSKK